jgi:hypothetical protein
VGAAEEQVEQARSVISEKADATASARHLVEEIRQQLARAEVALANAESAERAARVAADAAQLALRQAERQAQDWDQMQQQLSAGLKFPTEAEVAAAEDAYRRAESALRLHEAATEYGRLTVQIDGVVAEQKAKADRIEFLNDEADAVWSRLAEETNARLRSDQIRINQVARKRRGKAEDDLVQVIEIKVKGKWVDIADDENVSEGNRIAVAFALLMQHRRGRRVINIEGTTPLGTRNLEELARMAIDNGLIINLETAQGALPDGAMYVVHYPPLEES